MFIKLLIGTLLLGGCTIQPYTYAPPPTTIVYRQPVYVPVPTRVVYRRGVHQRPALHRGRRLEAFR
jgi:hypothetical protein